MLGICFIITQFVAMQKPQQRKYHSSCNRSVHRGTAHGKQEVKVCKRKTPHLLMRSFLSPYGDGTFSSLEDAVAARFSPPYGDGTKTVQVPEYLGGFSPPYGDGTIVTCFTDVVTAFSPPYGDGTLTLSRKCPLSPFSPPYGDCTYPWPQSSAEV